MATGGPITLYTPADRSMCRGGDSHLGNGREQAERGAAERCHELARPCSPPRRRAGGALARPVDLDAVSDLNRTIKKK